jgi:hypothetical protein
MLMTEWESMMGRGHNECVRQDFGVLGAFEFAIGIHLNRFDDLVYEMRSEPSPHAMYCAKAQSKVRIPKVVAQNKSRLEFMVLMVDCSSPFAT